MTIALQVAAFLICAVAVAHSYLGERYILIRLFRRDDLPRIMGGAEFTKRTRSMLGTRAQIVLASSVSPTVGEPKPNPLATAS